MELIILKYNEDTIRIIKDEEDIYRWVVRDIAKVLNFSTPHHAARGIDQKKITIPTTGGRHQISTVDIDGLMSILYRGKKDDKKDFRAFVNEQMIPSLPNVEGIQI